MANKVPMRQNSAIPESMKVATVAGEILRRIKNNSRDLPPGWIERILKEYMTELKRGGFTQEWREKVLESTL